jgi:hypothetical protein
MTVTGRRLFGTDCIRRRRRRSAKRTVNGDETVRFRSKIGSVCIPTRYCFLIGLWLLSCAVLGNVASAVDFNRDVRPILSDKCFLCHGPDRETREAGLRLDLRDEAISYGAISPGSIDDSLLWERILSNDPTTVMPPPETGKPMTQQEIDILQGWIESGAEYEEHWAFVSPQRPQVPPSDAMARYRNPIDYFVIAGLQAGHLNQSPPADRATLVRRLFLDLVGLPPHPNDLDFWLSQPEEKWAERLVEQLLESPHFGERWARWWLDAARYSDSDGYEKDKPREVWFYRDWVIQAMNDDMPYDQFVLRQIAGDLLPQASQSDRVATGFLRNSMVNEEGGADPEQFRVEGMFDRMDAIGKSILGITTQCAQCHSHKYDPLSQEEYYEMFAALNNFHEAIITVYSPEDEKHRHRIHQQIDAIEQQLRDAHPQWRAQLAEWHASQSENLPQWRTLVPSELPWEGQKFRRLEDGSLISESYAPTRNDISFPCDLEPGVYSAIRLDLLTHPQLPHGGPGRSIYGSGALSEFQVSIESPEQPGQKTLLKFSRAEADVNPAISPLPAIFRDRDPEKDDRVTGGIDMAIDGDPKTAWSTDNGPGRRNQDRHAIFVLETPLELTQSSTIWVRMLQSHGGWNSDDNQNYLMGRYRFSITEHPSPADSVIPAPIQPLLAMPLGALGEAEWNLLFSHWRTTQESMSDANHQIDQLWSLYPAGASQLAVVERERPRDTFVMLRGDFLSPGKQVQPSVPEFMHQWEESDEPARLRLARWLVDPRSPTAARVVVNRLWQAYFGRGIVSTPEDFGRQSPAPSHPELLDWLAVELMENNWSLKHLHRLITQSATYQQSSVVTAQQWQQDQYNERVARGPRFRLEAEMVRDLGLTVSGLLDPTIGGPSVYPPAPDFLFEPPASYGPKVWDFKPGEQYRRSLYVHSFRSVPYPPLQVFDAPKGEAACVRRERSNNPLQALVCLNEPQFVDFARGLAARILRESPAQDDRDRIRYGHRLVTGREPEESEITVLSKLLQQQRLRLELGSVNAEQLAGVSEPLARQLTGYSAAELVPWIVLSRVLLNLDETLNKG